MKRYSDKNFAKKYYAASKNGLKPFEKKLVDTYLSNTKKLLVVGCGAGRETVSLAKSGFDVTAIDIAPEMVRQTKKLCAEKKVVASVLTMDASSLNFKENTFDAVLFFNCVLDQIHSHVKRAKTVKKAYSILKRNGIAIAVSNNALQPGEKFMYWKEHVKHGFTYLKNRKHDFFDRVYEDDLPVYVHLSTPFYLRKLFKEFKTIQCSSSDAIMDRTKEGVSTYFDPLIIIVAKKVKA